MLGLLIFVMDKFVIAKFGNKFLPVISMIISLVELSMILDGVAQAVMQLASVYYHEGNYPAVSKVIRPTVQMSLIE